MKSIATTIIACTLLATAASAQDVIVLDASTQVVCAKPSKATVTNRCVYRLLNDRSNWAAHWSEECSKHDKLTAFEAIVTDDSGNVIKKIKKGDLKRTDYTSEMATDYYTMYHNYTPPRYPITIEYKWTSEMDGSVIMFPTFMPAEAYNVQVDKALYTLEAPASMMCRYKVLNSDIKVQHNKAGDIDRFTVAVNDLKPIDHEPNAPASREVLPMVYFAPSQFEYLGNKGTGGNWQEFGQWIYSLRNDRTVLSPETQSMLHAMTDTCKDDRAKLAVLYNHLEKTTRYVSIQLGIGGMQPFAATDVCRTGFGDCKGLSNYMCAMLECVGIKSLYAIISTNRKRILPDFASANQFNHAIAAAVIGNDTIWLECTNPRLPLGYVHDNIAGHQALLITPEGGKVATLPSHKAQDNTQDTRLDVNLAATGAATMHLNQVSSNEQYEDHISLIYKDDRDKRIALTKKFHCPAPQLEGAYDITEHKQPFTTPDITIDAIATTSKYASVMGSRMLVPAGVLHSSDKPRDMSATRKLPIELIGYCDNDTITVKIPEGYSVEALPDSINETNELGTFSQRYETTDGTITIITQRSKNQGIYPASDYAKYYALARAAYQAFQQKIALKRSTP